MNDDFLSSDFSDDNECSWAIFVLDGDEWKPVSYGDTEYECDIWLQCHKDHPFIKGHEVRIGRSFTLTL